MFSADYRISSPYKHNSDKDQWYYKNENKTTPSMLLRLQDLKAIVNDKRNKIEDSKVLEEVKSI